MLPPNAYYVPVFIGTYYLVKRSIGTDLFDGTLNQIDAWCRVNDPHIHITAHPSEADMNRECYVWVPYFA
ncbi:MAG TPA: hypothetical protein V6C84_28520 [Coleofasciculaceae cyanobacterium]|jgi:hypothetical protein